MSYETMYLVPQKMYHRFIEGANSLERADIHKMNVQQANFYELNDKSKITKNNALEQRRHFLESGVIPNYPQLPPPPYKPTKYRNERTEVKPVSMLTTRNVEVQSYPKPTTKRQSAQTEVLSRHIGTQTESRNNELRNAETQTFSPTMNDTSMQTHTPSRATFTQTYIPSVYEKGMQSQPIAHDVGLQIQNRPMTQDVGMQSKLNMSRDIGIQSRPNIRDIMTQSGSEPFRLRQASSSEILPHIPSTSVPLTPSEIRPSDIEDIYSNPQPSTSGTQRRIIYPSREEETRWRAIADSVDTDEEMIPPPPPQSTLYDRANSIIRDSKKSGNDPLRKPIKRNVRFKTPANTRWHPREERKQSSRFKKPIRVDETGLFIPESGTVPEVKATEKIRRFEEPIDVDSETGIFNPQPSTSKNVVKKTIKKGQSTSVTAKKNLKLKLKKNGGKWKIVSNTKKDAKKENKKIKIKFRKKPRGKWEIVPSEGNVSTNRKRT